MPSRFKFSLSQVQQVRFYRPFFLLLFFPPAFANYLAAQVCDCASIGACPTLIVDYESTIVQLEVSTDGPDDLSQCPLESVCFTIEHQWVSNISASLIAPSGTNYLLFADIDNSWGSCSNLGGDNVEVCIAQGNSNPLNSGTPIICDYNPCSIGYCCKTGDWTLPCGVYDPFSGASAAPNCDLNDFNQPGESVNGIWTLVINDLCIGSGGVLHNFSLNFACPDSIGTNPVLTTASPLACLPDSTDCQKVCAQSTIVYEVENLPTDGVVSWEVIGAQGFTEDNHSVTINWGDPGDGEVIAFIDGEDWAPPLQVLCGPRPVANSFQHYGYVQTWGGSGPFTLIVTGPNGYYFEDNDPTVNFFGPLVSGLYQVEVTDGQGNVETCEFEVDNSTSAVLKSNFLVNNTRLTTTSPSICDGRIWLSTTGIFPYSYEWSNGSTEAYITDLCCDEIYSVTVTDGVGATVTIEDIIISCPPLPTCYEPVSQCVQVLQNPKAELHTTPSTAASGAIEICQGQEVFFNNSSTDATNYIWLFGDGNSATEEAASHVYQIPGTYTAALIARNDCFCADTSFVTVLVEPADIPVIDCLGSVCESETVTYSTDSQCGSYNWEVSSNGQVVGGGDRATCLSPWSG